LPTPETAGTLIKRVSNLAGILFSKHPLVLSIRRGACFVTGGEDQKKIKYRIVFVKGRVNTQYILKNVETLHEKGFLDSGFRRNGSIEGIGSRLRGNDEEDAGMT
jgi:hypothetical protein